MLPKLQAHYVQAFTNYKSSDGSLGVTALQAGIQFKNGLYVGGTFSAAGLPLTTDNITISGTAGNGYIQYAAQTVAPSLALVHTYADSGGHFAIGASGSTANDISFTNSLMTANRSYAFQDKTGTLAMVGDNVSEFTNDSGFVVGPGSAVSGRVPSFNGTTGKLIQDSGINIAGTSGKTLTLTGGLTIGADTSIGGGGVITLGGFILTVPATGTAALLAANNVFTGANSFSGVSPIISFVDSSGVTATFGDSAGFSGFSGNRNFATGTIYDTGKAAAAAYVFTGNGSSYVGWGTTQANNTAPTERMRLINGLSIGGATDPGAGGLILEAATANLYLKNLSTGFQAATTLIVTPQSGNSFRSISFTSGVNGWTLDPNYFETGNGRFRGEFAASVFKVSEISATAGTFGVFYSGAALNADCTTPASTSSSFTFDAKNSDAGGMLFAVNDVVRFKSWTGSAISDSWATITARTTHTTYTTYTATLNSGSTSATFRAGTAVVDYGPSGAGFITLSADGTVGSSPNLTMATHAGSPWSAQTNLLRLGNLNGSYGYVTDIYGLGIGQYGTASKSWQTIDQTNGFRIGNNTTVLGQWDVSGNATFGQVATNKANVYWNSSNNRLEFRGSTNGTVVQSYIDTDGSFVAGGGNVIVNSAGLTIVAPQATDYDGSHAVRFTDSGSVIGSLTSSTGLSDTHASSLMTRRSSSSSGTAIASLDVQKSDSTAVGEISINTDNTSTWAAVSGQTRTFIGLTIGGTTGLSPVPPAPTHMLDVYGEGYFQSNVAIGTTSTGSVGGDGGTFTNLRVHNSTNYGLLTLSGPGTADGGNGGIISMGSTGAGSADKRFVVINGTSDGSSASTTNGRLDIYTTNAGTSNLALRLSKAGLLRLPGYGAGTLSTDASGNITASSDEKLKTNIRKFRKGLDTLKKLEPILYRWNKKSGLDRKHDYVGFGARHSKRHIPEAVGKGRDGFHTMSDRAILATAVNAIKELEQMYATR
jgi:hypothetical protein